MLRGITPVAPSDFFGDDIQLSDFVMIVLGIRR